MHPSDTDFKTTLNKAVCAKLAKKEEAAENKDVCEFVISDFQITMTLLLAIALVTVQFALGNLWIGFFIIIHSLMAIASAFLAVLWISNRVEKKAREVVKSQMENNRMEK